MSNGLQGRKSEMVDLFIKKAKERGYEKDAMIIGGAIALCKQNHNDPCDTLQALIDLIDTCKDDDEFIAEAGLLIGIE